MRTLQISTMTLFIDFEDVDYCTDSGDDSTQDGHYSQREKFSDAELEDVMQDLLSFEQPEEKSPQRRKTQEKESAQRGSASLLQPRSLTWRDKLWVSNPGTS